MGKNATTPKKSALADAKTTPAPTAQKAAEKAPPKKKSLVSKAAKAVAAVAVGVGSAIVVKSKKAAPGKRATRPKTEKPRQPVGAGSPQPTREDITLRAYFISERRRHAGLAPDPHQDWVDAERELATGSNSRTA